MILQAYNLITKKITRSLYIILLVINNDNYHLIAKIEIIIKNS